MAKISKIALIFLFFCLLPVAVDAATLSFFPSSGGYAVGKTLSVNVYVSSSSQAINAASGVISFPQDKLEVISLSKSGSIFTLWVQEPSFSNSAGTINFEGIVLNPGFTGATGKIITINFKIKAAGIALLNFSSGSTLANDGKGTNILTSQGNAQFNFESMVSNTSETITPSAIFGTPSAPQIFSSTHPDSTKWYAQKDAKFTWPVPSGITGVRLLIGKNPTAIPSVIYIPAIHEKKILNLSDGIWYFHAQFRNAKGWGEISHFRFQIDTSPPDPLFIKFLHGEKMTDPSPIITFNTIDGLSGIDHYQIKVGSESFFEIDPNVLSNPYALPPQPPGENTVIVQAYDKAGNSTTATQNFDVLALESPQITRYQANITEGDLLEVAGKTYPTSDVSLLLSQENGQALEQKTRSNLSGDFTVIWSNKLMAGTYGIQVQVTDNKGAKSLPSEKVTITVAKSTIFRAGTWAVDFLTIIIPFIFLIFAFLFILWHGWHKFSLMRKHLRKEVREVESSVHRAFDLLKENIREQIKMLEKTRTKRQLTEEEEKIINELKNNLDDAEKFIRKGIEDIEKEVK
jgi:hypothetical protein